MPTRLIDPLIADYLAQLRRALKGQDPALIQDAQYDAEEHLRAALAEQTSPVEAFADVCTRYGTPEEIADYYCDMESKVSQALTGSNRADTGRQFKGFFTIARDLRAYMALLYMLIALPTSILYFGWVMIVGAVSLALLPLVVGIPLFLLFLSSLHFFSLFEGRLIEMLLGQRMPRRPLFMSGCNSWKARFHQLLSNRRTWTTLVYLLLRLPLSFVYFGSVVAGATLCIAVTLSPVIDPLLHAINPANTIDLDWYWFPVAVPGGILGFILTLHAARLLGYMQAWLARVLLMSVPDDT